MAASEATIVDAGGRDLRVSSPDRVIFPETERSAAVTKLDVVKYYLAVEDGIMRALERRPTTLERWPKGVHPGIVALDAREGRRRRLLPEAHPAGSSGLRADRADPVPVGPPRGRDLSHRGGRRRLGGPDGHDHVPSVAGSQRRRRPSGRAAPRPRPAAGHGLRRRRARRRRGARAPGRARLRRLPEDLGRPGRPHLRPDRAALDVHGRPPRRDRLRARARAAPAGRR